MNYYREKNQEKEQDAGLWALGLALLLATIVGYWLLHTTLVTAVVSTKSWQIIQNVEELKKGILEEGWSLPSDAYEVSTSTRIHHYDEILSHTTSERIGRVTKTKNHYREDPVYLTGEQKTPTSLG